MDEELVSILIPVYNRVSLVGETIESAINQTYKNIEIIIVDNFSTDGTWELLQQYAGKDKRIQIYRNTENIGPVRNWICCAEKATGKFINILFSDDIILPTFISETMNLFTNETAFVISKTQEFDDNATVAKYNYKNISEIDSNKFIKDKIIDNNYSFPNSPCSTLFRTNDFIKSLIIEIPNPENLKHENYGAGNDVLIFLNIARYYPKIVFTKDYLVKFRSHKNSFTKTKDLRIYYFYTYLYFIKLYEPSLLSDFHTLLYLNSINNKNFKGIANYSKNKLSIKYMLKEILRRLIYKLKKVLNA